MNVHSHALGTEELPASPRKEAILASALALFAERGFDGTPVPVIAERAGVAAGTIYRHFESKEALANEVYRRAKGRLLETSIEGFPFDAGPREQFRAFWFRLVQFARENPEVVTFLELHHHAAYLDAESRLLEACVFLPFLAYFESEEVRPLLKHLDPPVAIAIVWGIFAGLFKACRHGHLPWEDTTWASAERAAWDAIAAAPSD